jgi:phosphatidylserine decarboxylase
MRHEYIVRETGEIAREQLVGDRAVRALYSPRLENAAWVSRLASSRRVSKLLGYLNYDNRLSARASGMKRFLKKSGIDFSELADDPSTLDTARQIFERKIRYWECRPLPATNSCVVCPADSRVALGSMSATSKLLIKEKFFAFPELLGGPRIRWTREFKDGDYAVFRLTPEKYHYTHVPVAGKVADFYAVDGRYHSCNPNATARLITPHSRNKRVVTIIDTNVARGTGIGFVAMIEVVALMIGQIDQCYSDYQYDDPQPIEKGMILRLGAPKALFRPGSSTVVLLFQRDRIRFADDLVRNQQRSEVHSRYSKAFGQAVVETDVTVRSVLALSRKKRSASR